MSWWWRRAIGAAQPLPHDEQAAAPDGHFRSVALVVGATGIVGSSLVGILPLPDTPGGPWKVYALSRRPLPPWASAAHQPSAAVTHIQVDLTDSSSAVAEALAPLTDITHVFYAALSPHMIEARNRRANPAMLRNVLSVVVPNCPELAHVCLQTGTKHYTGPPEAIAGRMVGGIIRGIIGGGGSSSAAGLRPPYTEDMPRLDWRNFYYDQEDVLFDAVSQSQLCGGGGISWSVHRPNLIFGLSPQSAMNIVCSLCVYAAICRKEGVPLRWPGSQGAWEGFSTASDADLVAEQQIWAAVDPMAKNEAFNCSNGDIFKWEQLWPILAERFGLEWVGYEGEKKRFKLAWAMPRKAAVWAEIVEENQLVATTQLHEVNWWFVDGLFYANWEFLDSMNKSKEHGFLGFRNTAKSFNTWIDKMKACKIVP
jgi:nucleoside-diphosphate-sugar epimerase